MNWLRDISIKWKLLLLTLLTSSTALLLAGFALATYETGTFKNDMVRDLSAQAKILGGLSTASLSFNEPETVREMLAELSHEPHIVGACIYHDGAVFAAYVRSDAAAPFPAVEPARDGAEFHADRLDLTRKILVKGQPIGTVFLQSDMGQLRARLRQYWAILLGVFCASTFVALVLSSKLQRVISRPLQQLSHTAALVARDKDYSVRVARAGTDELGRLTEAFNQMLTQIQAQDGALQSAHGQLSSQIGELRERARLASLDAFVGLTLTHNSGLEEILRKSAQAMVDYCGLACVRIWELNYPENQLELRAGAGLFTALDPAHARLPVSQTQVGRLALEPLPMLTNSVANHASVPDREWAVANKLVAFAGFPLLVGDWVVGVMVLYDRHPFSGAAFQTLGSIANAIALGIERKRTEAALKDNEERFRSLFENATIGLYRTTPAGAVLMANPTLLRMLGCASHAALSALHFTAGTATEAAALRTFHEQLDSAGEIHGLESVWQRRDGSQIFVRESAKTIRDAAGAIRYYEGTVEDVTERKLAELELQRLNQKLIEASRQAGMAEVATGVLHNVGNVLNSVNVSANLVNEQVRNSRATALARVAALFDEHAADLGAYLTADPKGRLVPGYIHGLAAHLQQERASLTAELQHLVQNLEHIKEIVAMQQSYARVVGVLDDLPVRQLVEDALRMKAAAFQQHGVKVACEFHAVPAVRVDKHKVLQILVNLLRNANYALEASGRPEKNLTLTIARKDDRRALIRVRDNGIGIPPENLTRIFQHGFTTKREGHGFGLHSGANAAREMGGSLQAQSDGPGLGATFTLELPLAPVKAPAAPAPTLQFTTP